MQITTAQFTAITTVIDKVVDLQLKKTLIEQLNRFAGDSVEDIANRIPFEEMNPILQRAIGVYVFVDNTQPIPEPVIQNVKAYCNLNIFESREQFMCGAQYGYNLGMVMVKDVEAVVEEYRTLVQKLEAENEQLRNQIKP